MNSLESLEKSLDDLFVKKAPPLPPGGKKALVEYLPWINLVLGLLELWTVSILWHWAHVANSIGTLYGSLTIANRGMNAGLWLGLVLLGVQAIIYIAAFSPTKARKKSGWDLLFYALLLNIVYGAVIMFTSYGGVGNLISSIIGSGVGFYLLFQIRSSYSKESASKKSA